MSKIKKLEKYTKDKNYTIDMQLTEQLRNALSDDKINLRIPSNLKQEIIEIAKSKNIPYQRFVKSILIEAVVKHKLDY